jgi:iron complex outermembrane recepter protein
MTAISSRKARLMLACAFGALTSLPALPAMAQTTIEEVVVTARKREESLQTVPVAVTAQSGAQLESAHITEPTQLTRITPSLQIRNSSGSANSAQIALRGQYAADSLLGVSQPIGLYQDNVNIPHPFGSNNAFFDIERVEILKGPQGTLYGRNTTGGAINIITRSADYHGVHGFIEGDVGNFKSYRGGAAVNVPLIADMLAVRLVYQYWSQQGFGRSLITGQHYGDDKNDHLARLSVKFDPTSSLSADLKVEYGNAKKNGSMLANVSLAAPQPATTAAQVGALAFVPPNSAYVIAAIASNYRTNSLLFKNALFGSPAAFNQLLAAGQAALAPCVGQSLFTNCSDTDQFDNVKTWHGSLDVKWDVTEHVRVRSITGVRYFTNDKIFDLDSIPGQVLEVGFGSASTGGLQPEPEAGATWNIPYRFKPDQQSTQWSQEFNVSGDLFDDRVSWLVGAYGSWDKGKGSQWSGALIESLAITGQLADGRIFGEAGDDGVLGSPPLPSHDGLRNITNTWAVFTQNDIKFTDQISITLGARYTEERIGQDLADWSYISNSRSYTCSGVLPNGAPTTYAPSNPTNPDTCYQDIRSYGPNGAYSRGYFNGTTYLASLNFQVTPDHLLYAKISRGFRGGAFGRSAQVVAAPEFVKDLEAGFKGEFFDHRLRTNLAVYQSKYNNKQVSSLVCISGLPPPCGTSAFTTLIANAAKARIRGFEAEVQARPTEGLSAWGTLSYTDAKYTDYPNAVSGDGVFVGDAAGVKIAVTPTWQGSVGARYEAQLGGGLLGVQADVAYRGKTPITALNDLLAMPDDIERHLQRAVKLVNARVDYDMKDRGIRVSLWAQNLFDVKYGYKGISPGFTGGIGHIVTQAPRTYGVTVRKTFGEE